MNRYASAMSKSAMLLAFAILAGGGCVAKPGNATVPTKHNCSDEPDEQRLLACRRAQLKTAEAGVRDRYGKLLKNYRGEDPELARSLDAAHAAWQQYRDTSCELETYYSKSGTGHEAYRADCLTVKNQERIAYYDKMLDQP